MQDFDFLDTDATDYYISIDNEMIGEMQGEFIVRQLTPGSGIVKYIELFCGDLADENAKNYLYSLGNDIAKYTVDLAIGLRTKSYITGKNELETEQENQLKFIEKSLKKIMNES